MAMTMTNKFGQKYRCLLPDIGENDGTDASSLLPSTGEGDSSSEGVPKPPPTVLTTENVRTLLAPMAKEPCLIRTKDWWSYELCYDKAVRQFHIEGETHTIFVQSVFKESLFFVFAHRGETEWQNIGLGQLRPRSRLVRDEEEFQGRQGGPPQPVLHQRDPL